MAFFTIGFRLALLAGLVGSGIGVAQAAAMRCSGEEKTCIAVCNKGATKSALPMCITNCGQRKAICMKSGCWDNGVQKYCGLVRQ